MTRLREWLAAGYAGEMRYIGDRLEAYEHPSHVLDGARSVVMLAMNYRSVEPRSQAAGEGRVARYAWSADYHDLVHERLRSLAQVLLDAAPTARVRGVVDTAPLLEREFAQLAGLGWIGKNTLLLNARLGSWFFLAALLTDLELNYDDPFLGDHCGTCRACLDACPTGAFPVPYVLDSRKCISYLTIELRSAVPREMRAGMGDWLFGCDICQEVCPWNRHAPANAEKDFMASACSNPVELASLFWLDDAAFRRRFRHTPLWRPKRRGVLRNAAIVLGNQRDSDAVPGLARGLDDPEPMVRGACAWALGQCSGRQAMAVLRQRALIESDADVLTEIASAIDLHLERETREL